jgi:hypothetical protein
MRGSGSCLFSPRLAHSSRGLKKTLSRARCCGLCLARPLRTQARRDPAAPPARECEWREGRQCGWWRHRLGSEAPAASWGRRRRRSPPHARAQTAESSRPRLLPSPSARSGSAGRAWGRGQRARPGGKPRQAGGGCAMEGEREAKPAKNWRQRRRVHSHFPNKMHRHTYTYGRERDCSQSRRRPSLPPSLLRQMCNYIRVA